MKVECASHVDETVAPLLNKPVAERIQYIDIDWRLNLPFSKTLTDKLSRLAMSPDKIRPHCMLIAAAPGMGKTHIAREVQYRFPMFRNEKTGRTNWPVVFIEVEPRPTSAKLITALADQCGLSTHTLEARELQTHVKSQIKAVNVKLIIFDEVQSFLGATARDCRTCCDTLRWISNTTQRPVVAMGGLSATSVFESDPHLRTRFRRQDIPYWTLGPDLQAFVRTILTHLPLKVAWDPAFLKQPFLTKLLECRGQTTQAILDFFKESAIDALSSGKESLSISEAMDMG